MYSASSIQECLQPLVLGMPEAEYASTDRPQDFPVFCGAGFQGLPGGGAESSTVPPAVTVGGMQSCHGFLPLLRGVQLLLAVH